jgi:hypothetical protein
LKKFTIIENAEVMLNGKTFLLEKGDQVVIEDKEEYPVHDKDHTQSAIGYIMKYKDRKDESGKKARRNRDKVSKAAKKFEITLPDNFWE